MTHTGPALRLFRFGPFEADPETGELRRNGRKLRLQEKPFQVLVALLEQKGKLVSRKTLHERLWPGDTFVDFENGLNTAISKLREVLGDSAQDHRYIETLARRGYRFASQIEEFGPSSAVQHRPHARGASTGINPSAASVAVLPFVNLSADPENEFFADGITEDVIAHLAKIRSLKVISRTSVFAFKKRDSGLREIGAKLGAATLLDGSVRRAGNRVRIVAQLVDVSTDEHIWADTYDRDLTDIFAIQTDVSLKIANALRAELSKDERARVSRRPTADLHAYELYLRGRNAYYRFTEDGFRSSMAQFEAAVARDPGFALAWASLAEVHAERCILGHAGSSPEQAIPFAKQAAARAVELDDQLAEAHGISGLVRFAFDFDWRGAESEFLRAIELSPSSSEVHTHYSWLCVSQERYDDAVREVHLAYELDPLMVQSDVANTLLRAGHIEEAIKQARRGLQADPGAPRCHSVLGWALIFRGDNAAGIAELEHAVELTPRETRFLAQLGEACALTGNIERALQILSQLRERATREFVSPYHFAYVHAGLGEADAAIDWLERAYERRSGGIYGIKGSFLFRNLHGHPRFESLLRRMNLA